MKNILQKISNISCAVESMSKDGTNTFQNYKYLSETQITTKMKPLLDKNKVVPKFSWIEKSCNAFQTAKGGNQFLTTVEVDYSFCDVDSGEEFSGKITGQGADAGDKGIYKAVTGAIKYLYMKTFNIPTGDDPENERSNSKKHPSQRNDLPDFI